MTMYDYFMLDEHGQVITLAKNGVHIATLDNGATVFELYSVSIFFVELEFEKFTEKLVGRSIFQSGIQIEKYLPDTGISI